MTTHSLLPEPRERVARAAIWYWIVVDLLWILVVGAASITPISFADLASDTKAIVLICIVAVLVAAVAVSVTVAFWRYAVHRWEVTPDLVLTRSGAIFRDWRIVPLHRIQTVEVTQGIVERIFGVAKLVIRTASYHGSTDVAGMPADRAREVASQLTEALQGKADDGA